jgi:hypothetical protein
MKLDALAGMKGLRQIYKSLVARGINKEEQDEIFEKHSAHFLNRCFSGWMKR